MCLIFISYQKNPDYPLIVAANRDEFYERPTASAKFWNDYPSVLAGMDLEQRGTWLGITKTGRFAAITNFRNPALNKESARSRGELTRDFLTGEGPAAEYIEKAHKQRGLYNSFNLIIGDSSEFYYCSSELEHVKKLAPGNYGLSNGLLDSDWPKVTRGKQLFGECVNKQPNNSCLLDILTDQTQAKSEELPNTGIEQELELTLSSRFISTPLYGTRASTLLTIDKNGQVHFLEKNHPISGRHGSSQEYTFDLIG